MAERDLDIEKLLGTRAKYRTPGGLFVAFSEDPMEKIEPTWRSSPAGLAFPAAPGPSLFEQMVVLVDADALGVPESSVEDIRELLKPLPYTRAVVWSARVLGRLWPVRLDPEAQMELARELFGDADVVRLFEDFLAGAADGERRHLFSEQQLHALERLALESAEGDPEDETWSDEWELRMRQALLGTTSVIGDGAAKVRDTGRGLEDWLGFFAQNGAYNANSQPLLAYQRAWRMYVELPATAEAQAHPSYCPLDEWSREQGADLKEMYTVGFAAMASATKRDAPPQDRAIVPPLEAYLKTTALADRHAVFTDALSAAREYYIKGFARSRDNPVRLAWELTPFLQRPFMRIPDGPLVLLSPRALEGWLTDGVYYRLLDFAAEKGRRDDFTTFAGWLFEAYVLELFGLALGEREPGAGRVHGEQEYSGKQLTSDVALDFGEDVVLFEVVSVRLPLGVRAEADEEELNKYIKRSITDKLNQLDHVVTDVSDGRARIPDVDPGNIKRIWPVLVTMGEMLESEALWALLNREVEKRELFHQPISKPVALMGVEDVEAMLGLVAAGDGVVELLSEKGSGPHRELSWARWLKDTREGDPPRLPALVQRWEALSAESVRILGFEDAARDKA